ncbi:MAG: GIY-YIG nuclease family protein [Rhodobacteraceae bacterium]|nr:GIY-YIG nuclease family protein [Paracoccaceae bacterium]
MPEAIYILINQAMPGLVKIGRTEGCVEQRMKQIDTTGVPLPFECFAAFEVENGVVAERALHTAFGDHRIRDRREFFRLSPDKPTAILRAFGGREVTPGQDPVEDESDQRALDKARSIRPRFRFEMADVAVGSVLTSVFDDSIQCKVLEDEKVLFRGEQHSLTSSALVVANEFGKNWKQIQGPRYWKFEDEALVDLRDRNELEDD